MNNIGTKLRNKLSNNEINEPTPQNSILMDPKHLYRLKFFSNRVDNNWNKLPEDVVEASSVNMLKNRLDQHRAVTHTSSHQN